MTSAVGAAGQLAVSGAVGGRAVELVPGSLRAARGWLRAGCPRPVSERPAATVCLLRPAPGRGVDVLWIRRSASLAFAPGALAFPGGVIEADDPGPAEAAARELTEETGLTVEPTRLLPLARWVTPAYEPRRFDTWFLGGVADPGDAAPRRDRGEVAELGWSAPSRLLAELTAGERWALPPTLALLGQLRRLEAPLAGGAGTHELSAALADLAATADLRPVLPVAAWRDAVDGDVVVRVPDYARLP